MSVKISDYKLRVNLEGKPFFTLTLQGGVEIVKSVNGNSYATVRTASMPTTFDELTCQSFIGSELPGTIKKVETEAYNYALPETGEVIVLNHRNEYVEEEKVVHADFTKAFKASNNQVAKVA